MSYFSAALDALMRENEFTQLGLSRHAGVHQGQLSQYLQGLRWPEAEGLERLCTAFGADGVSLLVAYLRDQIPESLRDKVEISPRQKGAKEKPGFMATYERLPRRIRELLEDAARECERRPAVVAALESTLALTRPE
ncbi:MAG: hypothetical protein QOE70_5333 [Chthoniobacter sp.]|jgi:transcriptional regulator with XRE-family HTH domain|nr:hypothetical protein [Chthoniobacter sp.]